jgi:hypothetical protein
LILIFLHEFLYREETPHLNRLKAQESPQHNRMTLITQVEIPQPDFQSIVLERTREFPTVLKQEVVKKPTATAATAKESPRADFMK